MTNDKNNKAIEPLIFDTPELRSKFINNPTPIGDTVPESLVKAMDFDVRTKSFEEKIYIVLYRLNTNEDDDIYRNIYSVCIGRTEAYSDIKDKLISGLDIDIHRSLVMTETKQTEASTGDAKYYMIPYNELISVYSFCTSVKEYYNEDDFDIEDYNEGDSPENFSNTDNAVRGNFLTTEQIEYRNMLEQSMQRNKFIHNMRDELGMTEVRNI